MVFPYIKYPFYYKGHSESKERFDLPHNLVPRLRPWYGTVPPALQLYSDAIHEPLQSTIAQLCDFEMYDKI